MKNSLLAHPKFAVVGHPNKGKSTIVSALALDDSIQVSDTPGTTTKMRSFPLRVDGKILYELFDTPGFQRARAVLSWLEKHVVSADKRSDVLKQFIEEHRDDERFNDEIQLLTPIMNGAGIIYVVDASKPYGKEYESEMEILRWTGQPSMALLNHIDTSDYSDAWKRALEQYFKMVRTFNPMETSLHQHMQILESMAQLKEEWIAPVKQSMRLFEQYHEQMLQRSASLITQLIYRTIQLEERLNITTEDVIDEDKEKLEQNYKNKLRNMEEEIQRKIEKSWNHSHIQNIQNSLTFEEIDLFSQEAASIFGLTRKELIVAGISSGAVTGAGIDLIFAGHTLLIGGAIGSVVGGIGAYWGFDELADIKVLGKKISQRYLQMGPMKNRNFPYIVLGRVLYYTLEVSRKSHATRNTKSIVMDSSFKELWLDVALKKSLEAQHKKFRANTTASDTDIIIYENLIINIIKKLLDT